MEDFYSQLASSMIPQGSTSFNPAQLTPVSQPMPVSAVDLGMTEEQYQSTFQRQGAVTRTVMQAPDGTKYMMTMDPRIGKPVYDTGYSNGQKTVYLQNPQTGAWEGKEKTQGNWASTFRDIVTDKKFMTFLAIAGAGIAASSYFGAAGAGNAGAGSLAEMSAPGMEGAAYADVLGASNAAEYAGAGVGTIGSTGAGSALSAPAAGSTLTPGVAGVGAGAAGGVAAGAAQGATQGATSNWLQDLIGNAGGSIRDAGSLALIARMYDEQKGNAQEWRNFMKEGTPDLGFYQGKLKESYENPSAWLQGPQFQAAQNVVHNKLQRSDAAGGRLANDVGRQKIMQDYAFASLGQYQGQLGQMVTQQQNTATGQGGQALSNAQNQESEWMRNLMNWLQGQGGTKS